MIERLESSILVGLIAGLGLYLFACLIAVLNSIIPVIFLLALGLVIAAVMFVVDVVTTSTQKRPPDE